MNKYDYTFLLPCLNEELTLKDTIDMIKTSIITNKLNAEILVVDNNSVDNSCEIALLCGARVVKESNVGYGNALRRGIKESSGTFTIMGDADTTYDFININDFIKYLNEGFDFVIGNRYCNLEKGSMSFSHYWGVKFLSFIGRLKYKVKINDFHCGLRAFRTEFAKKIEFKTTGMEFATEMIHKFMVNNASIKEVNSSLKKCKYKGRTPHLKTIKDGFKHLKYIILN